MIDALDEGEMQLLKNAASPFGLCERNEKMKIIMLGAPGAGKGTQAKKIAQKYGIPHISTGDIFRANIKGGTELGKKAKSYMDQGMLVPDEVTIEMLLNRIQEADCRDGYVLDGFPRTIPQAESLTEALNAMGDAIDYAIDVAVPDEAIITRMAGRRACLGCGATYHMQYNPPKQEGVCDVCGGALTIRKDDNPETVKNRLKVFHAETEPLKDFYAKLGILKLVEGNQPIEDATRDILKALGM